MTIRIVVCIDVLDEDDAAQAYSKLHSLLTPLAASGLGWESTDEWFDIDGEPFSEEVCRAARNKVFRAIGAK